jgi:hypothetical protein
VTAVAAPPEVGLIRLYMLRAMYLLLAVGLGLTVWPGLVSHEPDWPLWNSVGCALLGTIGLLALIGLRHPLRMLPLLFVELGWKMIWLLAIALPLWRSGQLDPRTAETVRDCLLGIIVPIVIPWPYVWRHYVRAKGEAWR